MQAVLLEQCVKNDRLTRSLVFPGLIQGRDSPAGLPNHIRGLQEQASRGRPDCAAIREPASSKMQSGKRFKALSAEDQRRKNRLMKNQFEDLAGETKLKLLREADQNRPWQSLDDTRHCILCEKIISGRTIRVSTDRRGATMLHCPTRGCHSTPTDWVHPENPLISEDAWRDWIRMLDSLCDEEQDRPIRRFRPSAKLSPSVSGGFSPRLAG